MADLPPRGRTVAFRHNLLLLAAWAAVVGLLYLALRGTPAAAVLAVLGRLHGWQLVTLAAANAAILVLMAVRWWVVLRALGGRVSVWVLLAYRLAGFGVSYFTPGPQFGGEPVQVHLLHWRAGLPLSTAVSGVLLDRLIDLLANFTFLVVGILTVMMSGVLSAYGWTQAALFLALPLLFPLVHLVALWRGYHPLAWLFGLLAARWRRVSGLAHLAYQSEEQIGSVCRTRPAALLGAIALSGLTWTASVFEFWLMLSFLGLLPDLRETIIALTSARLAFLLPLPAGLGALEAGQSLAARLLGWGPASGIAVAMLIRGRDVFLGLVGLGIGGAAYRSVWLGKYINQRSR